MKCVVVGASEVGKTCLVLVFQDSSFTISNNHPKVVDVIDVNVVGTNNQVAKVAIYDTAGQDEYDDVRPAAYKRADLFVICFSVDNRDSYASVWEKWYTEVRRRNESPILLVGTKSDVRISKATSPACVSRTEAIAMARRIGACAYAECSAKIIANIPGVLKQIAKYGTQPKKAKLEEGGFFSNLIRKLIGPKMESMPQTGPYVPKTVPLSNDGMNDRPMLQYEATPDYHPQIATVKVAKNDFDSGVGNLPTMPQVPDSQLDPIERQAIAPKILAFLTPVELARACEINRRFQTLASADDLWEIHCKAIDPSYSFAENPADPPKLVYQIFTHGWVNDFTTAASPVPI